MANLPKVAAAVAGAAVAAALVFPPSRRQTVKIARATLDELVMRTKTGLLGRVLLLTTEGHRTNFPRTVVLAGIDVDGETYVLPWSSGAHWLRNLKANPEVVVDDRVSVRRARAEVVGGDTAEAVRSSVLRALPGPLGTLIEASGVALRRGTPVVRFEAR
ncbi:MAG TPA: nitroreductase family deazaflavin-dependent oxidoreductase [Candidatus Dormibacteraeota bacterium]|nr:nitroreductase family deazaflavin-dependent oxidoreductase [Candidatus Dormibacteraeota bacterium]